MKLIFGKKLTQYLFFEIWPGLLIGLVVFILILLMLQALRLTEFFLVHGISFKVILEIISYMAISFLPALFPMAVLFAVVMTYGRLSQDSEVVAMKSLGYSQGLLLIPALILGVLVTLISAQTSFHLAPWGNRQFEILITKLGQTKAAATIKEGTFSENFFDLVVYANEVDSKNGELRKVFIYNEQDPTTPLTIIANQGHIIPDPKHPGQSVVLRLEDGDIHRKSEAHTKIKFSTFEVKLFDNTEEKLKEKSPPSLTIEEIKEQLSVTQGKSREDILLLKTEFHKRWAISIACIIFAVLGGALGTQTNRRVKSNGLILSLMVILVYWILYVSLDGAARSGQIEPAIALWLPNILFSLFATYRIKKIWN